MYRHNRSIFKLRRHPVAALGVLRLTLSLKHHCYRSLTNIITDILQRNHSDRKGYLNEKERGKKSSNHVSTGTCKLNFSAQLTKTCDKRSQLESYQGFWCFLSPVFGKVVSTPWTDTWLVPVCIHITAGGVLAFPSAT